MQKVHSKRQSDALEMRAFHLLASCTDADGVNGLLRKFRKACALEEDAMKLQLSQWNRETGWRRKPALFSRMGAPH